MERRAAIRRVPAAEEPLSRVRLRTGRELVVVDVSSGGLLVEGVVRLLPGTHVDVHVVTGDGRVLVRCRITRAYVSALAADDVRFRGALAFDRPIDTAPVGYGIPRSLDAMTDARGSIYPAVLDSTHASHAERLST